jgi:hypothetical protein
VCVHSFTGAFHCPVASEFCTFETVTGIQYSEFKTWQVWIILGVTLGIPVGIFLLCLFPCIQDRLVARLKQWCVP